MNVLNLRSRFSYRNGTKDFQNRTKIDRDMAKKQIFWWFGHFLRKLYQNGALGTFCSHILIYIYTGMDPARIFLGGALQRLA